MKENQVKQALSGRVRQQTVFQQRNRDIAPLVLLPDPQETLMLLAPMWVAVGAAALWHKLASDIRNPLRLLPPRADDREELEGLAVRFDVSKLNPQELRLFSICTDASLYNSGFLFSDVPFDGAARGERPGEARIAWNGALPGAALQNVKGRAS